MDLEKLGKVAGIGGIAFGAIVLIFRDIIARSIFSTLPPELTYSLLQLIVVLAFVIGLVGVLGWIWQQHVSIVSVSPQISPANDAARRGMAQVLFRELSDIEGVKQVSAEVREVWFAQKFFLYDALDRYLAAPDDAAWKVLRGELRRVAAAIESAKDGIIRYTSSTRNPVDFTEIASQLSERYFLINRFSSEGATERPDANTLVELRRQYAALGEEMKRVFGTE